MNQLDLLPKPAVVEKPAEPRTHIVALLQPAFLCTECGGALKGTLDIRVRPMPQFVLGTCMSSTVCPNHGVTIRVPLLFVNCQIEPAAVVEYSKLMVPA